MGDKVAVLADGKLQQYATPPELYDRPANAFVAGFIGSPAMNLLELPRSSSGVSLGGIEIPLTREITDAAGSRDKLTVGIRPEDWVLESTDADAGSVVKAVVDVVEELGSESYLYAHLAEDTATKIVVRGPGRVKVRFGDPIAVRPTAEALHVFDVESGERLD